MKEMFMDAKAFNQPLDKWIVSKVKSMEHMFNGAAKFDQDLSDWKLNSDVNLNDIFRNSGMSQENYCKLDKDFWKGNLGLTFDCNATP